MKSSRRDLIKATICIVCAITPPLFPLVVEKIGVESCPKGWVLSRVPRYIFCIRVVEAALAGTRRLFGRYTRVPKLQVPYVYIRTINTSIYSHKLDEGRRGKEELKISRDKNAWHEPRRSGEGEGRDMYVTPDLS